MNYVLKGHNYIDDVVSILMMFYPNDKYIQTDNALDGITVLSFLNGNNAYSEVYYNGKLKARF